MNRKITAFDQDEERHWRAQLECGHYQHVRNNPPLANRPWVLSVEGRQQRLGVVLECAKCEDLEAADK